MSPLNEVGQVCFAKIGGWETELYLWAKKKLNLRAYRETCGILETKAGLANSLNCVTL